MADAQPLVSSSDNGVGDLLKGLFSNSSQLFGSGTAVSKSQSASPASVDLTNSNQLLQSLMQGADPNTIDEMIKGIFDKAKVQFGPNISNSLAAGNRALTDTTLADIQARAIGQATAQAAATKLQAITQTNQLAAQVTQAQLNAQTQAAIANANTNKTTTTQTTASPTGKTLATLGVAATGYSIFDKIKKKYDESGGNGVTSAPGASDFTKSLFGSSPSGDSLSGINLGDFTTTNIGQGATGAGSAGISGLDINAVTDPISAAFNTGNIFTTASNATAGDASVASGDVTATPYVNPGNPSEELLSGGNTGDVLAEAAGGLSSQAITDAFGASSIAGTDAAGAIVGDAGIEAALTGADLAGGAFGGAAAGAGVAAEAGAGFEAVDLAAVALWVICTELKHQGKLSKEDCQKANPHFQRMPEETKEGYYFWAMPYVKLMRNKKYGKLFTSLVQPLAQSRVDYLNGKFKIFGMLSVKLGEPICFIIGKMLSIKEKLWLISH